MATKHIQLSLELSDFLKEPVGMPLTFKDLMRLVKKHTRPIAAEKVERARQDAIMLSAPMTEREKRLERLEMEAEQGPQPRMVDKAKADRDIANLNRLRYKVREVVNETFDDLYDNQVTGVFEEGPRPLHVLISIKYTGSPTNEAKIERDLKREVGGRIKVEDSEDPRNPDWRWLEIDVEQSKADFKQMEK